MKMFKRRIGHPHQFYELGFDCLARCSSCTRRRIECRPWSYHFFLSTDMTDPTTRIKTNSTTSIVKKTKKNNTSCFLLLQRERGLNRNTTCIWYVQVWELKLYFYPSARAFLKSEKKAGSRKKTNVPPSWFCALVFGSWNTKISWVVLLSRWWKNVLMAFICTEYV